ncbi:MAG: alpha/beta fold hydrolase [Rhodocyclaceae bacterium]|jgi:3-oxoadipate enol-lactonase|nr:alpha/beta fold hydrolase [Rhodocyclaceae bacterium]
MKTVRANGIDIRYDVQGRGPWITFAHSLASDLTMWDDQLAALSGSFTILRYDIRGHGGSSVPPGPYRFEHMVGDVLGLLDALGVERTHFVGLSMGGMIGQHLALAAPQRLDRLVLSSTASGHDNQDAVLKLWEQRIAQVVAGGMSAMVEGTLGRWFTEPYRLERQATMARIGALIAATSAEGYAACGRLIPTLNTTPWLGEIALPTLVLVGEEDPGTVPAMAEAIARGIPGARLEIVPRASHLLNIEQAELFNELLLAFFAAR